MRTSYIPVNENTDMLRITAGSGIIHYSVREEGPVQRRKRERKQCDGESWKRGRRMSRSTTKHTSIYSRTGVPVRLGSETAGSEFRAADSTRNSMQALPNANAKPNIRVWSWC